MTQCAATDCKNNGVHAFPKDPERRKLWEKALKRKNWKPTNSSKLCSVHFKPDDYYGTSAYTGNAPLAKFLKRSAVPSVFSFTKSKSTPLDSLRKDRLGKISKDTKAKHSDAQSTSEVASNLETIEVEIEGIAKIPQNVNSTTERGTQANFVFVYGCIKRFINDDEAVSFYTGLESYKKFNFVFSTLQPMINQINYYGSTVRNLSTENQFFLTMIKLKQDKCNFELSRFFNVSPTTVTNIFITWINVIHQLWSKINIWPEKDLVRHFMPDNFKKYYACSSVKSDGTEINVKKPPYPVPQPASGSTYVLFPHFLEAFGGSVDNQLTVESIGSLPERERGDSSLADGDFNGQDIFPDSTGKRPTYLKEKSQLPAPNVFQDRELACKRVHIERIKMLLKSYKILKNKLNNGYVPLASKIFFVCLCVVILEKT